eukprot:TRINITY_DN9112_c0_g1_i3.p1 TRINITY_DN9112_c0_g1~~TRINITY_DN9112_c0_g1_i3.p1  ORF type:complete len:496 (+),score=161.22 TRINITY_DN9112_c0_g1_i3:50-1537(+)
MNPNTPVYVINQDAAKGDEARAVQLQNIQAGKAVSDIVRTCLGPRAMLKMLMDPMGGIVMTSDGNAILREIMVQHPAAKSMIEIARAQDEEVGDGTTTVIILAGEVLSVAAQFMEEQMHPVTVIGAYLKALDDALSILDKDLAVPIDLTNSTKVIDTIKAVVGTKLVRKNSQMVCEIALSAVQTVMMEEHGRKEIDLKKYAKVEKIPGGELEDSRVLRGVMLNKDVTHSKMSRRIDKPRILLLDCSLEYKKGESKTDAELTNTEDFTKMLQQEEAMIKRMVDDIVAFKPDLIFTEKGISDLAQHYLVKHNITGLRRVRKSDNLRIARATGATIVSRTDEIKESDLGLGAGLFEVRKIGDEYFTFIEECDNPKACTILLRGASKDVLMEGEHLAVRPAFQGCMHPSNPMVAMFAVISLCLVVLVERNLQDAMQATRNLFMDARLVAGGGATEMELAVRLAEKSKSVEGVQQWPYKAIAQVCWLCQRACVHSLIATN